MEDAGAGAASLRGARWWDFSSPRATAEDGAAEAGASPMAPAQGQETVSRGLSGE